MAGEQTKRRIRACNKLRGEITPPGDKSISHRALILNSIAGGQAAIANLSGARDCVATVRCLRKLGVRISSRGVAGTRVVVVEGRGEWGLREPDDVLNAGNSGTTVRLLSGLLCTQPFLSVITGDSSLRGRPMARVVQPLSLMGAEIWGRGGGSCAPLAIRGGALHGIDMVLPVASAQVKSAVLLGGLFATGSTRVSEPSRSRDHTERLLLQMGARLDTEGDCISLTPLDDHLKAQDLHVPGDISSAAYFLVAGAIHPDAAIVVRDCGVNPTRTGVLDVLSAMGARLKIGEKRWMGREPVADIVIESSDLRGVEVSGDIIPRLIDEVPALAVAGCMAEGRTVIRGAAELRVKESDRIATISAELSRLGARVETLPDGMVIHGRRPLRGSEVHSHSDHRVAMSLAVAGLVARGETTIVDAGVVAVSYPGFWPAFASVAQGDPGRDEAGS